MLKHRSVAEMLRDPRPIAGGDGTDDTYEALDQEVRDQLGTVSELNDEELGELKDKLNAIASENLGDDATAEQIGIADQALSARDAILVPEVEKREAEAAEVKAKADELRERLNAKSEENDEDTEENGSDDGEEESTETTTTTETTTETKNEEEKVPVAASVKPKRRPPGAANAHRPKAQAPAVKVKQAAIIASADVPGVQTGHEMTFPQLGEAVDARWRGIRNAGGPGRWSVASIVASAEEDRQLDPHDPVGNMRKIEAIASPEAIVASMRKAGDLEALVAAGGICTPLPVSYDIGGPDPTLDRPFRDALVSFQATRGGVSIPDPLTLAGVGGAVDIWRESTDASPGNNTKTRLTLTCNDSDDFKVDAITARVKAGNWLRRYAPEQFNRAWRLIQSVHARTAENDLWSKAVTASKNITTGQDLGAARDVLFKASLSAAQLRSYHRLPPEMPMVLAMPMWVRDMLAGDVVRQLPGDNTLGVGYAEIDGYFRSKNIQPVWSPDANQVFSVQTDDGPIIGYDTSFQALLFPAGTFLFLDGGRIDFGMEIRDATLNATNDVEAFFETFEGLAKVGPESYEITFTVCADGSTSSTVDVACTAGASGS